MAFNLQRLRSVDAIAFSITLSCFHIHVIPQEKASTTVPLRVAVALTSFGKMLDMLIDAIDRISSSLPCRAQVKGWACSNCPVGQHISHNALPSYSLSSLSSLPLTSVSASAPGFSLIHSPSVMFHCAIIVKLSVCWRYKSEMRRNVRSFCWWHVLSCICGDCRYGQCRAAG